MKHISPGDLLKNSLVYLEVLTDCFNLGIMCYFRMVHQPSGGARGQATDIAIQAEEIIKLKKQLNEIYVKHTKQKYDFIHDNMERDKVSNIGQLLFTIS